MIDSKHKQNKFLDYVTKNEEKFKRYQNLTGQKFFQHLQQNLQTGKNTKSLRKYVQDFFVLLSLEVKQDVVDRNCIAFTSYLSNKKKKEHVHLQKMLGMYSVFQKQTENITKTPFSISNLQNNHIRQQHSQNSFRKSQKKYTNGSSY